MHKKDLHLGKSLDDLKKLFNTVDRGTIAGKPLQSVLASLKKIAEEAEKTRMNGDEETAYVLYMRYMALMSLIQKQPEFVKEKQTVTKLIGNNETVSRNFDKIEALQESLRRRYEAAYPKVVEPAPVVEMIEEAAAAPQQQKPAVCETIDCKTLYAMISGGEKLLIMDCRSGEHYEESRMDYMYTMNVPEEIIKLGMSASKIKLQLPNGSRVYWEMRLIRKLILVDWFSSRFNRNSTVWHLKEILTEWDQENEKQPEIFLLEGGYDSFKTHYPMKCINPHAQPPTASKNNLPAVEDIEYPNLADITMKDESFNNSIPMVDRSMKASAVSAYEDQKSKLELLDESLKLEEQSIKREEELLTLEQDLNHITKNKENNEDSSIKEQTYMFKIWELQSKQRDTNGELKSLKEQLDKSKPEIMDPQAMTKVKQVEIELQEKERKRRLVQDEVERNKREREENLKIARSKKPALDNARTPPKVSRKEELILSPKSLTTNQIVTPVFPSFDRSAKPLQTVTRQIFNDKDFSPVYGAVERGLTGLKNLGNTCYMNSIIQCLSNTSTLTEFLLENQHEKYVNRSNKTKGHIVRTLAAVIKMLWNGECKYISSKHLKAAMGEQEHLFYGMEQQDSHEFLIMLIDWLQSDLQTITVQNTVISLPASEKAWLEYTKAKESFILRLFYGQIKSTVKCTVCGGESATYETFSNLSLELPPNNIDRCHISDCFSMYFNGERVSGWSCPTCKAPREAIKKLDISKLPPILVVHMKRFYADPYSNSTFRKKTIYVDFPLTDMNMLPYVARSEKNSGSNTKHTYKLYAVSNHYGTMESGHYTAYCRNHMQEKWYKFDDHTVSAMDRNEVKSSAAYILFYTSDDEKRRGY